MSQGESGILRGTQSLIALGSNQDGKYGSAFDVVEKAIRALDSDGVSVLKASEMYKTPCFPAGNGPDFVNAVVLVASEMTPKPLLKHLHDIEADFGRKRANRWGQRILDLDLLAQGALVLPDRATVQSWIDLALEQQMQDAPEQLILPHPRLQDRSFVLIPLADVFPAWCHPVTGKTVSEMVNALSNAEKAAIQAIDRGF